jgi:four helix bundle protein
MPDMMERQGVFLFEKLGVYQRGIEFADKAFTLIDELPRGQSAIADQLKRAVISIPLNIAEGNGRWHQKERRNFFFIARGSAFECVPLLTLCQRRKWIEKREHDDLRKELVVLSKMLNGLIRSGEEI